MPKKGSLKDRLRKAGIRSFDVLIHDQDQDWLIKNFKQGATDYPVNVARLMRNIVWQTRERIIAGEKIKHSLNTPIMRHFKASSPDTLSPYSTSKFFR